jgi:hypothetical protein
MRIGELILPCGCKIWNDTRDDEPAFFIEACEAGTDCKYVRYVMEETARLGNPTEVRRK